MSPEGQAQVIASLLAAAELGTALPLVVERALAPRSRGLDDGSRGLGLHRLEAGCRSDNPASGRVLEKVGFREYGYAERYLRLGGRWHDHRLFELLNEDWDETAADLPR
ncbi:GNAT family protein [Actinomyces radicidentis]|uniref:GNAT family N-acetyltransferase n=1 Tax=Actinomyces radicidentis TaxID=111015 RepID=UPI0028E497D8|nr:GNAT family protein [Actinomyces radicidentis]